MKQTCFKRPRSPMHLVITLHFIASAGYFGTEPAIGTQKTKPSTASRSLRSLTVCPRICDATIRHHRTTEAVMMPGFASSFPVKKTCVLKPTQINQPVHTRRDTPADNSRTRRAVHIKRESVQTAFPPDARFTLSRTAFSGRVTASIIALTGDLLAAVGRPRFVLAVQDQPRVRSRNRPGHRPSSLRLKSSRAVKPPLSSLIRLPFLIV
jgi:hypothetical protein